MSSNTQQIAKQLRDRAYNSIWNHESSSKANQFCMDCKDYILKGDEET